MSDPNESDYKLEDLKAARNVRVAEMRSAGTVPDQSDIKVVAAVATGSEIESTLEACRGWLAMQTAREGCLTTAGDIIDDLRCHTDSLKNFRAAVFPNLKDEPRP